MRAAGRTGSASSVLAPARPEVGLCSTAGIGARPHAIKLPSRSHAYPSVEEKQRTVGFEAPPNAARFVVKFDASSSRLGITWVNGIFRRDALPGTRARGSAC
jgi:hypothetical protein